MPEQSILVRILVEIVKTIVQNLWFSGIFCPKVSQFKYVIVVYFSDKTLLNHTFLNHFCGRLLSNILLVTPLCIANYVSTKMNNENFYHRAKFWLEKEFIVNNIL